MLTLTPVCSIATSSVSRSGQTAPELARARQAQPHLFDGAVAHRARDAARSQGAVDHAPAAYLGQEANLGAVGRERIVGQGGAAGLPGHGCDCAAFKLLQAWSAACTCVLQEVFLDELGSECYSAWNARR